MFLETWIRDAAFGLGIPAFGIVRPAEPMHFDHFNNWIEAGWHANMAYLARPDTLAKRNDPSRLMPGVQSILVLAFPYPADRRSPPAHDQPPQGRIAGYAQVEDYHVAIPRLLEDLMQQVTAQHPRAFRYQTFTDSSPIMERDLAQAAGLGWIGKNSCLIAPKIGSLFLLGEVFTDLTLQPCDPFTADRCGSCRRCIDACPTGCIIEGQRTIDAHRCISYLTIENRGAIPPDLRPLIGDRLFGCDVCQDACPWNRRSPIQAPDTPLRTRLPQQIDLHALLQLTNRAFQAQFQGTALLRARRAGLLRNATTVLGNLKDPASMPILERVLIEEIEPLVRGHAAWALGQYSQPRARAALEKRSRVETDEMVRSEIYAALEQGSPG